MPNSVDVVRFRIDRFLLGDDSPSALLSINSSGFVFSGVGDDGCVDGVETGVTSKFR